MGSITKSYRSLEEWEIDFSRVFLLPFSPCSTTRSIFLQQRFDHATAFLRNLPWPSLAWPLFPSAIEITSLCHCPIRMEVIVIGLKVPGAVTRLGCETCFCHFLARWPWVIHAISSDLASSFVSCPNFPPHGFGAKVNKIIWVKVYCISLKCFVSARYIWIYDTHSVFIRLVLSCMICL